LPSLTLALAAWALYDLANTTFSLNVVSRYLPLLVIQDLGGHDLEVSVAYSCSMVVVAISSPLLGALSDQAGRRMPFLATLTAGAVLLTAMMGLPRGKLALLLLFGGANFCYQAALVFYDALLPVVSSERDRGAASGLGVALGYVGAVGSLYLVALFAERWGRQAAFLPTAVLFLVFAAPCFIFVRESKGSEGRGGDRGALRRAWRQLKETVRDLSSYPGMVRFLLARFLYTDAINTVILFMSVFAVAVGGLNSREVTRLLALSTVFAVLGAVGQGFLVDRLGPKRPLLCALGLWLVTFIVASTGSGKLLIWVVGPLAGIGLGATWTADRVLMLRLSPERLLGQFYGFYGMVGRFAAVVGPLVWGGLVYGFGQWGSGAYRIAVLGLLVMAATGMSMLVGVREPPGSGYRDERSQGLS